VSPLRPRQDNIEGEGSSPHMMPERGTGVMDDTLFLEHGNVEPHAPLLKRPADSQNLIKIMRVGDFLRSVKERYLHF
jgi:hypothetical protein